jgi:hypothetical protein
MYDDAMPRPVLEMAREVRRRPAHGFILHSEGVLPIFIDRGAPFFVGIGIKSRDRAYGTSVPDAGGTFRWGRKEADRLACEVWNRRWLAFRDAVQPPPTFGN